MSHTLTYHSIQNFPLRHPHVGRGIGPYAPAPSRAHAYAPAPALVGVHAHANSTAPADTPPHTHANATTLHPRYCAEGSTSVIRKMTIPRRQSPFVDDLVRSNPPLHQDWLKDLFDVCM
ncbi:hypothetical protein O181_117090 [Austropuccinia psidii MF-1]|uniref:Uncharacterized protein n=1 Tax=Austropuccinia psidii MF-1 TaxID=1389203 RepID=A0A9Q3KDQ6_9BASI|nr:hypothetical protein [Austropuccinia psidii MF-1]